MVKFHASFLALTFATSSVLALLLPNQGGFYRRFGQSQVAAPQFQSRGLEDFEADGREYPLDARDTFVTLEARQPSHPHSGSAAPQAPKTKSRLFAFLGKRPSRPPPPPSRPPPPQGGFKSRLRKFFGPSKSRPRTPARPRHSSDMPRSSSDMPRSSSDMPRSSSGMPRSSEVGVLHLKHSSSPTPAQEPSQPSSPNRQETGNRGIRRSQSFPPTVAPDTVFHIKPKGAVLSLSRQKSVPNFSDRTKA